MVGEALALAEEGEARVTTRRPGVREARAAPHGGIPGPIWPPTRIPGCVAWLDMQQTFAETAGTITSIRNMASGVDWEEAVLGPAYDATGLNGRPAAVPNGTTQRIISTEAAVLAVFNGDNKAFTAQFAFKVGAFGTAVTWFGLGNSGIASNDSYSFERTDASASVGLRLRKLDDAGTGAAQGGLRLPTAPDILVLTWVCFGNSADLYLGASRSNRCSNFSIFTAPATVNVNQAALFARPDSVPDQFFDAPFGAAVVWDHALPDAQWRGVAAAMCGRWGIPP